VVVLAEVPVDRLGGRPASEGGVSEAKNVSTAFSQEQEGGVK
jgi:hypothetical protein